MQLFQIKMSKNEKSLTIYVEQSQQNTGKMFTLLSKYKTYASLNHFYII